MDEYYSDILIIGSGAAGSYAAMQASALGAKVSLVTKTALLSGSTRWAQGGVAFPSDPEDIPIHLLDTMQAGRGLVDKTITNTILSDSLQHLELLVNLGMNFDSTLALEGGHSKARVRHVNGDESGLHLLKFLHSQLPREVTIFENHFAAQLIEDEGAIKGCIFWRDQNPDNLVVIHAGATILATGGLGQLYPVTTNPKESTGDGIALAYRAGATVRDLELVQFHPTVLSNGALISEACRGEGAVLLNGDRQRFMHNYDSAGELAPRDTVTRAIFHETKVTGNVFLDLRAIRDLQEKFPTVYRSVTALGFDPTREPVPIYPAAHYSMGGVRTDSNGSTSLTNLYAVGEVASTGFHGANRLASNSLLESLVMGARAATEASKHVSPDTYKKYRPSPIPGVKPEFQKLIKDTMDNSASVTRDETTLQIGLKEITTIPTTGARTSLEAESANLRLVALMVLKGALARKESRGSHFRSDYPAQSADALHIEQSRTDPNAAGD